MCKLTELQHNIHSITKDGYDIAAFLADTMRGETPGVKVNHRMDAAKQLIKYGFTDINCDNIPPLPQGEGRGEGDEKSPSSAPSVSAPVSYLDILNYEIAHLIRHGTAEGHTIVNFLVDIMTGRDRPFTPKKFRIKPADRMAAARELLRQRLRRLRLKAQALRHQRRSKRLRHPAHRPRQTNARVQRTRHRHHPLPARIDV